MRLIAGFFILGAAACAAAAPRPQSPSPRNVPVNGAEIAYVSEGTGPPLVVIHGAWGDYRSFSGAAPVLRDQRMVVRVSLRHHWPNPWVGSERDALEVYRVETHAADVVALIEKLGLGPTDVLGHSYGGVVAALVAHSRPNLVRKLVLVEPSLYGMLRESEAGRKHIRAESEWRDGMLAKTYVGQDLNELAHVMNAKFDEAPENRRRLFLDNAHTVRPVLVNNWVDVPFTCEQARQLRMPVLLIEGEKTDADMRDINLELMKCLPGARRVVLPNSTHTIQFDAPEAMARTVGEFLQR